MSLSLLFHTVRHLTGRQILGRLRHRVRPWTRRPESFARIATPGFPGVRWRPTGSFLPPGAGDIDAPELRRGAFRFVGETHEVGWPPAWTPDASLLWRYNLHYFEFLWALSYSDARDLARDWIERHPLRAGAVGWDPYPTSLRLGNWCALFFERHASEVEADPDFRGELWRSIYRQAEWLGRNLETHLLGNHLFENGVALALVGACFSGPDADRWRDAGLAVLRRELPEQILADGAHFERSPMYQSRVVWTLLALRDTRDSEITAVVSDPLDRALAALERLCHPDGEIALLNDSAFGVQNRPADLLRHAGRAPAGAKMGAFALADAGYYGSRDEGGRYLICDAGPFGPEYLLGHAHGDLFSFELSLTGHRVVVDAGVSSYVADEARRYCRSTAAHNTVEVDGEDQGEFWAPFRTARRAHPRDVDFEAVDGGFRLAGWHDGYLRLASRARHARTFRWDGRGVLLVKDRVSAERSVAAVSRVHLHPACRIVDRSDRRARVVHGGGSFRVAFGGEGEFTVEDSYYCSEFGAAVSSCALVFAASGSHVEMGYCIAVGDGDLDFDLATGAVLGDVRVEW